VIRQFLVFSRPKVGTALEFMLYTLLSAQANAMCTRYCRNDVKRLRLLFGSTIMSYETFYGVRGG
jgi:hypothetical protein